MKTKYVMRKFVHSGLGSICHKAIQHSTEEIVSLLFDAVDGEITQEQALAQIKTIVRAALESDAQISLNIEEVTRCGSNV